jgi:hypothetical protein
MRRVLQINPLLKYCAFYVNKTMGKDEINTCQLGLCRLVTVKCTFFLEYEAL